MGLNPNPSQLDQTQILQRVYDKDNDALRTDAFVQVDTINADLTVDIKAASGDNIAIANADGSEIATITVNGSHNALDVNLTNTNPIPVTIAAANPGTLKSFYNEITSVASNNLTTINSYTVPVGRSGFLQKCCFSGTTIGTYTLLINSIIVDKKYTVFGSSFNDFFGFADSISGLPLNSGDVVQVQVIHQQTDLNNFNNRIQVIEV